VFQFQIFYKYLSEKNTIDLLVVILSGEIEHKQGKRKSTKYTKQLRGVLQFHLPIIKIKGKLLGPPAAGSKR
jgi:hypothetical protein